ncbi:hypothetical protein PMAYCL1PPCAC_02658 [Pristionchus mayeri]|uniref:DUF4440 domain-containing protein n=1 Tax=Pristionchus mayeri TaxID=1317129 RepID=A0AAN5C0P2_9BILA|nr:hypothetical protein PMAYCL1PPCAC_02658 [Pristionchus mayeri]
MLKSGDWNESVTKETSGGVEIVRLQRTARSVVMSLTVEEAHSIYDELVTRKMQQFNEGNSEAMVLMFEPQGVLVDKKNNKCSFGREEIRTTLEPYAKLGKMDFKTPKREVIPLGADSFFVRIDYQTTVIESGIVLTGTIEQIFKKNGEEWLISYEIYLEG